MAINFFATYPRYLPCHKHVYIQALRRSASEHEYMLWRKGNQYQRMPLPVDERLSYLRSRSMEAFTAMLKLNDL